LFKEIVPPGASRSGTTSYSMTKFPLSGERRPPEMDSDGGRMCPLSWIRLAGYRPRYGWDWLDNPELCDHAL